MQNHVWLVINTEVTPIHDYVMMSSCYLSSPGGMKHMNLQTDRNSKPGKKDFNLVNRFIGTSIKTCPHGKL